MANAEFLYATHRDGVFRYLCRIVGHGETARDLTQEVFLRVARAGVPEAGDVAQRAWIFRIARNLALNHIRDDRRRVQTVELADASRPATQELAAVLGQAVEALEAVERDVFLMREAAGLSYEEIAIACELTPDAVRSRLHRARQRLRATLGPAVGRAQRARGVKLTKPG